MALYLQMDSVDDWLKLPATMGANTFVLDVEINSLFADGYKSILDCRAAGVTGSYYNVKEIGAGFTGYKIDGVNASRTINDTTLPKNKRISIELVTSTNTSGTEIRVFGRGVLNEYTSGKIYGITCKNSGGTVVASYDTSTGTVQDQSGNGNHATLIGGTWLDDGTGGGDTGTDGSIILGLTQQIYSDSSVNLPLTQQIYADISANLDLIQSIYKDTEAVLNLTQSIYQESELGLNLRQEIYAEAESILNLIQEFYEDSQTYITLQLIQQIYKDSSADLPLKQVIYKDSEIGLPLRQEMYAEKENTLSLNQTVYKDDSESLSLSQVTYKDSFSSLPTVQQVFIEGEISLPLLIQIRDDLLSLIGEIRLIGKRVLNVYLQGNRVLNVYLQGNRELNVLLKGGIDMTAVNQNFSMIAGDTKNLIVTMSEDLTGASVKWAIKENVNSTENILLKTSTVSGTDITIKIDPVDTLALTGTYYHECEVTDQLNNVSTVFTGRCLINKSGI